MIQWMMWCISTTFIFIISNKTLTKPFNIEKELRQGDLKTYFLFVIVEEALNFVIEKVKEANLISGLKIGLDDVDIIYLQYVADTLFFFPSKFNV